jgi:hypothetical protein
MTFKRKTYTPAPSAPLKPLTVRPNYAKASVAVPVPKVPVFRSEPYRRFVASFACMACGAMRVQCAHSNQAKHGKAGAKRACDRFTFPLCADSPFRVGCHTQHDQCIDMTKDERDAIEDRYIERMHLKAAHAGWKLTDAGIVAP